MSNPPPIRMPARGDRSAPTFDPTKPRELRRYFEDLEFLFTAANVTDNGEKKRHTVRYVAVELADIWETLSEYLDNTKTYDQFKAAIRELYPDADDRYRYTLGDLDLLIGNRHRLGIHSLADLADYHSQFLAITKFLISQNQLSELEQKHAYVRGFPPVLWAKVSQRLQLKDLDHLPDKPYEIAEVQAAAQFVLHGTRNSAATTVTSSPVKEEPTETGGFVKTEQLSAMMTDLKKTLLDAMNSSGPRSRTPISSDATPRDNRCNFCGGAHFIRNCELVEDYIHAGKVKRNVEGRVILPTGAYVPREISGANLKERIDEWHRKNPGQLATGIISSNTSTNLFRNVSEATPERREPPPVCTSYQLSAEDRIALLEAEIFNLRARNSNFTPIIRTRAQRNQERGREESAEVEDAALAPAEPSQAARVEPVHDDGPEHPF